MPVGLNKYFRKLLVLIGLKQSLDQPFGSYRIHQRSKATDSIIGDFTYISSDTHIQSAEIGKFCSIGPNTVIGYAEHPVNFISTSPVFYHIGNIFGKTFTSEEKFLGNAKVIIGNDVWVGANVFIKSGVCIADGAVIGAGAVVIKDVAPYTIVVGVPARPLKQRFPADIVELLLKVKWWNWSHEELENNHSYFVSEDLTVLKNFLKKRHEN